ncbi:hypothetical protein [Bosea sp. RAC05]|uniref:hypothetical protein n=1 Tax=Bosea sp. RAC05 TaxID=1842539 RepID=UPI00083CF15B|nr:hypothetical protein [Bosea sp. RAC05]AOG03316.1 hypothetical protein BSY19_4880 [Bosea sp. RAC05]
MTPTTDTLTLSVFADYFQFYLLDESVDEDLGALWDDEAVERLLAVGRSSIGIGTARNMAVPVAISLFDEAPDLDLDAWDMVNECSLLLRSGRLVILGGTAYLPDAPRLPVAPGDYRVRISYAGLDTLSENGLEGDDFYRIDIWPAEPGSLVIHKARAETPL